MSDLVLRPVFLVIACALAYAAATFAMKQASVTPSTAVLVLLALTLGAAVAAEVMLLRRMGLGLAYIAILATEAILVLSIAAYLGEGLRPRELAGAALILAGSAILWS